MSLHQKPLLAVEWPLAKIGAKIFTHNHCFSFSVCVPHNISLPRPTRCISYLSNFNSICSTWHKESFNIFNGPIGMNHKTWIQCFGFRGPFTDTSAYYSTYAVPKVLVVLQICEVMLAWFCNQPVCHESCKHTGATWKSIMRQERSC